MQSIFGRQKGGHFKGIVKIGNRPVSVPAQQKKEEEKMLSINMDDVMNVLGMIKTHLIVLGVIVVLAIAAIAVCGKMTSDKNS